MIPRELPDLEKQLREALRTSGRSIRYISRYSRVSRSCISRFLSGRRTLTLRVAARLAKILKLTLKPRHTSRRARGSPRDAQNGP